MTPSCLVGLLLAAAVVGLAASAVPAGASGSAADDSLCFNQLQVLGSHNSYHQAPPQELLVISGGQTASPLLAWQYSQPPLTQQLDAGVRALELDAYWDPQGGVYGQAAGLRMAGQNGWLTDPKYKQPGFKVLHVPDFDVGTSCVLLADCLQEVADWSASHPAHLPIQLYIEVKEAGQLQETFGTIVPLLQSMLDDSTAPGPATFVKDPTPTAQTFRDLQAELQAAFGGGSGGSSGSDSGGRLLTPDDVRALLGAAPGADLAQLLLKPPGSGPCPWPPLSAMRGKVLVALILRGSSPLAPAFNEAYPGQVGSLAWVAQDSRAPLPQAVFRSFATWRLPSSGGLLSLALPSNASDIVAALAQGTRDLVAQGYIVRVRADADTVEARAGYTGRRDALMAAGPQVVATDFLVPASKQRTAGSGSNTTTTPLYAATNTYSVSLPGGQPGRCLTSDTGSSSSSSNGSGSSAAVQQASGQGDSIYCGELVEGAAGGDPTAGNTTSSPPGGSGSGNGAASPSPAPPQDQQQQQQSGGVDKATSGSRRQGPLGVLPVMLCLLALAAVVQL